jgi:predicted MPP superfamily phosphohydrolase
VKKAGIKILNNEMETVNINDTDIDIIGLTQNPKEYDTYGRAFFEKALSSDDNFKLVLTHYPENFLGVLEDYDIDLALAGNAHGGQVRLPFIGGVYSPDQGLFPKLCDGYHEIGNSRLIITRGLGKSGLVPRINNKPEIAVIDISWY